MTTNYKYMNTNYPIIDYKKLYESLYYQTSKQLYFFINKLEKIKIENENLKKENKELKELLILKLKKL